MNNSKQLPADTRKVFMTKGSCSQALCFLLNREFDHHMPEHEKAMDPFAGGLLLLGHQCGMLWGSAMAAGMQAARLYPDPGHAAAVAVTSSMELVKSYHCRTGSVNCRDVCGHDFTKKVDLFKFMLKFILHINRSCLDLADTWTPEAYQALSESLHRVPEFTLQPVCCASITAKKMGASDEEALMVAGFAGGIGLSGNACGALGAAVWVRSMAYRKDYPGKTSYNNPYAKKTLKKFLEATGSKILCRDLCGHEFKSIDEHTRFINDGGCGRVMEILSES